MTKKSKEMTHAFELGLRSVHPAHGLRSLTESPEDRNRGLLSTGR